MKYSAFLLVVLASLSACTGELEQVAKDTREQVTETKEGAQVSVALEVMLDEDASPSARVAGAKSALLRLPEDRLGDYLGTPIRVLQMPSVKRSVLGADVDLLNVVYVGETISTCLRLAPTSASLFEVYRTTVDILLSEIELKSKASGLPAEEVDALRVNARRLNVLVPAVLGAVSLESLTTQLGDLHLAKSEGKLSPISFQRESNLVAASLEKIVSIEERTLAAERLRAIAANLSLTEEEVQNMNAMTELRMGVR